MNGEKQSSTNCFLGNNIRDCFIVLLPPIKNGFSDIQSNYLFHISQQMICFHQRIQTRPKRSTNLSIVLLFYPSWRKCSTSLICANLYDLLTELRLITFWHVLSKRQGILMQQFRDLCWFFIPKNFRILQ